MKRTVTKMLVGVIVASGAACSTSGIVSKRYFEDRLRRVVRSENYVRASSKLREKNVDEQTIREVLGPQPPIETFVAPPPADHDPDAAACKSKFRWKLATGVLGDLGAVATGALAIPAAAADYNNNNTLKLALGVSSGGAAIIGGLFLLANRIIDNNFERECKDARDYFRSGDEGESTQ